jgi:hypothetical protein
MSNGAARSMYAEQAAAADAKPKENRGAALNCLCPFSKATGLERRWLMKQTAKEQVVPLTVVVLVKRRTSSWVYGVSDIKSRT